MEKRVHLSKKATPEYGTTQPQGHFCLFQLHFRSGEDLLRRPLPRLHPHPVGDLQTGNGPPGAEVLHLPVALRTAPGHAVQQLRTGQHG